jgi:hypothetical protein
MINPQTLPPPSYSPYAYFPQPNYLTKPMPLMATGNSGVLQQQPPPPTFVFPSDIATSAFFRNQTYPSPPQSTSPLARTTNPTPYQNGNKTQSNNEQLSTGNDGSKNHPPTDATLIRTKPR